MHAKFRERMLNAAHDPFARIGQRPIKIEEKVHFWFEESAYFSTSWVRTIKGADMNDVIRRAAWAGWRS